MRNMSSRYLLAIAAAVGMLCAGFASTASDAAAHSPAQVKAQASKQ